METGGVGIKEAARLLGVSERTAQRWFDADQPASGTLLEPPAGRTRSGERICSLAWIRGLLAARAATAGAAEAGGGMTRSPGNGEPAAVP